MHFNAAFHLQTPVEQLQRGTFVLIELCYLDRKPARSPCELLANGRTPAIVSSSPAKESVSPEHCERK